VGTPGPPSFNPARFLRLRLRAAPLPAGALTRGVWVAIIAQREDGDRFEASVTDADKLFHVKLRVVAQGVHEYGREEDL
jgi:hypothetical protein